MFNGVLGDEHFRRKNNGFFLMSLIGRGVSILIFVMGFSETFFLCQNFPLYMQLVLSVFLFFFPPHFYLL